MRLNDKYIDFVLVSESKRVGTEKQIYIDSYRGPKQNNRKMMTNDFRHIPRLIYFDNVYHYSQYWKSNIAQLSPVLHPPHIYHYFSLFSIFFAFSRIQCAYN